ncbi:hypothetical protein [Pediococcus parvulus]|uniref:Uncharacterized protein n=1 Tax=Pediococcus parvulus TaxID=54062 RepID=A0A176TLS6_9LACO|nr:hypothetical protein [Pediococcus parvulus]MCT3026560.1 hypothetical protein [Pediococcus parvulus]MCT3031912.1 hypothetical protein [Pediococcus parvulus]MDV7693755.1 hypothetical protein [Pediococcus parvulus]OAD64481.1 hypothetical protein A7K95_04525 [Pediococcus parvulus]GEL89928.1 hypothetical protein PPA04_11590 [Pediococcus parvulus]
MRLVDFNLSVAELDPHLQVYFVQDKRNFPVESLRIEDNWLIMVAGKKALTLDQFKARAQTISGAAQLAFSKNGPHKLFGYHLRSGKLILG